MNINTELFESYAIDKIESFENGRLDGKYMVEDADKEPYYVWSSLNDSQTKGLGRWLISSDPNSTIIQRSSSRVTGYYKDRDIRNGTESCLVIPEFRFVSFLLDKSPVNNVDYESVLKKFDLNNKTCDPFEKIHQVQAFKEALYEQIVRQANAVADINQKILDVLKVYQFETGIAMLELDIASDEKIKLLRESENIFKIICEFILRGADNTYIKETIIPKLENWKKYSSNKYWQSTRNGLTKLGALRSSLLETSMVMIKQYLPSESLMEDMFLNGRLKNSTEFNDMQFQRNQLLKYQGDKYWETAHQYYYGGGLTWPDVYEKLETEMANSGLKRRYASWDSFKSGKKYYTDKIKK